MRFFRFFLTIPALAALFLTGCGKDKTAENKLLTVTSGIPPVAYLVSAVGGDRVDSKSVLPEGRSPHDYSPGPGEIKGVMSSKLFFTTGLNFEKNVSRTLDPKQTRIVDVTAGIKRIPFDDDCRDDDEPQGALDPHIWLSADNAAVIAENIAKALTEADPKGAAVYTANLAALKKKLASALAYAKKELKPYAGREFFVYHPAFGYFAKSVGLKQVAIELGGREATAKQLAAVIERARKDKVKVVFVQPQFNPTSARALGKAIGGKVAGLDPLAADIPANIRAMAGALKEGFTGGSADGK